MRLHLTDGGRSTEFDLDDGEYLVGRAQNAAVRVTAMDVSGQHALLRVAADRLFVTDLESRNGTFVDGNILSPAHCETEVPRDIVINFASAALRRATDPDDQETRSALDLVASHTYYGDRAGLTGVSSENIGEMLSSLFGLIAMDGGKEDFEHEACRFVSRWIPCDRAVLMLDAGPGSEIDVTGAWTADDQDVEKIHLSTKILGKVLGQRESLLLADTGQFSDESSDSIHQAQLTSAMAVPLFDNERVRGILYVDSREPGVHYGSKDLETLSATANAVAVKLAARDMAKEMLVARRIQRRMCPARVPDIPDYDIAARLVSCFAIGGDFYHVGEPIDGKVLIVLGDVMGKGLPAALTMAACSVLVPALDGFCDCPCTLVERLHRSLEPKLVMPQFVTLFVGTLNLATGRLQYVNAGHSRPLIVRPDGSLERLEPTGGVVGIFKEYVCTGAVAQLSPGDLLTVFSDGVTEATTDGDQDFGRDRAEAVIIEHRDRRPREIMDILFNEITGYLKGAPNSDDTTLVIVRRCREWTEPS